MFCSQCGIEFEKNDKFCRNCGSSIHQKVWIDNDTPIEVKVDLPKPSLPKVHWEGVGRRLKVVLRAILISLIISSTIVLIYTGYSFYSFGEYAPSTIPLSFEHFKEIHNQGYEARYEYIDYFYVRGRSLPIPYPKTEEQWGHVYSKYLDGIEVFKENRKRNTTILAKRLSRWLYPSVLVLVLFISIRFRNNNNT